MPRPFFRDARLHDAGGGGCAVPFLSSNDYASV